MRYQSGMAEEAPWYEQVSIPALLRQARYTYGKAMRAALEQAGYDDIPANGLYIIGGLALDDDRIPLRELVKQLGVTKQGAGQLVDTLVMRGYLSRAVDESDRRQLIVALTDRGRAAAEVQTRARDQVDAALLARVSSDDVSAARKVLGTLTAMHHEQAHAEG
jgi:DNA-binding MarR family transcriptional regulator